jgi:bacterioferritin-associated ferredoxin
VYVCHCRVVSDHRIRTAIAGGARSVDEVGAVCDAGTGCGGCHPAIEDLLAEAVLAVREPELLRARQARRRRLAPVPALAAQAAAS